MGEGKVRLNAAPVQRGPGAKPKLAFTEMFGPNIANKTEQWPTED
jgi:hypothetical protein